MWKQVAHIFKPLLPGCIIFSLLIWLWQYNFQNYLAEHPYQGDIFRPGIRSAHLPFYIWDEPFHASLLLLIPAALSVFATIFFEKSRWFWVFALVTLCGFALSESPSRLFGHAAHFQTFAEDVPKFENISDIFNHWQAQQPLLSIHNQHYPPGVFILIYCFGGPGIILLSLASVIGLLILLQRQLSFSVAQIFLLFPGVLIFSSLDPGLLYAFWGWLFFQMLQSGPSTSVKSLGSGIALFICSMLSYMFIWIVLITGLYYILSKKLPDFKVMLGGMVTFIGLYLILYIVTGYSGIVVFLNSIAANMHLNGSSGWDDSLRWLIRSLQNLLQFVLATGPLLFTIHPKNGIWSKLIYILLPVAACSGLFFGETDRVWIPFLPFVALAIHETQHFRKHSKTLLTLSACSALLLEFFFKNYI